MHRSQMFTGNIPQLRSTFNILHLLCCRNKNQHRRSTFWKWLSILKRCLGKLVVELAAGDGNCLPARILFLDDILLPRCYASFTQLVHDSHFSPFALALNAEIAKIQSIISSITVRIRTSRNDRNDSVRDAAHKRPPSSPKSVEDLGEALARSKFKPNVMSHIQFPELREAHGDLSLPTQPAIESCDPRSDGDATKALDNSFVLGTPSTTKESYVDIAPVTLSEASKKWKEKRKTKQDNPIDELFAGLE